MDVNFCSSIALHALALVRDDPSSIGLLDTAAQLLAGETAHGELFRVQYDLGSLLGVRNQYEQARSALDAAGKAASHGGSEIGVGKVSRALHRVQELQAHGGLTRQEYEVAKLARAGRSNKTIAERMCLATATVEFHLSKVYRKLGITGRRELGSAILSWRDSGP